MEKEDLEIKSMEDIKKIYSSEKRYFETHMDKDNFTSLNKHSIFAYNFILFHELVYLCYLDFLNIKAKIRNELGDLQYLSYPHGVYQRLYVFYFRKHKFDLKIDKEPESSLLIDKTYSDSKNILHLLYSKNSVISLKGLVPENLITPIILNIDSLKLTTSSINIFLHNFINTL